MDKKTKDWKQAIISQIERLLRDYEEGSVTKWGKPLVGFADAKKVASLSGLVSPGHEHPEDVLKRATIVVAYFVPFLRELAQTNTGKGMASPQWARSYEETNAMFVHINQQLIRWLEHQGFRGAVPSAAASFDRQLLISNWSQRHIAYLAGLGTFGLNNMLITKVGCCGRISTIITDLNLVADKPMKTELCVYKQTGSCGLCADVCPSGALTRYQYDRHKCYQVCRRNAKLHNGYGNSYTFEKGTVEYTGSEVCGKCVAGMPCAFRGNSK